MPHYANGAPAGAGDVVVNMEASGAQKTLGILVSITPGSDSCNGAVLALAHRWGDGAWYPAQAQYPECVTLKECLPLVPAAEPSAQ